MRRFVFSLATVLKVRRTREDSVQREFSVILQRRAACLLEIGRLEHMLEGMVSDQEGLRLGKIELRTVGLFELGRKACMERILRQLQALEVVDAELEAKRQELVAASRDRKVLEKLEENQKLVHLKKENREEQGFLDELASHLSLQQAGTI